MVEIKEDTWAPFTHGTMEGERLVCWIGEISVHREGEGYFYFSCDNNYPMEDALDAETIEEAKKEALSRLQESAYELHKKFVSLCMDIGAEVGY